MFSRFRNLFSKNKDDSEIEAKTDESCGNSENYADMSVNVNDTSEESSKLEGLNLLKSIVESEQQGQNNDVEASDSQPPTSLSEEVAELLKKRLSRDESQLSIEVTQENDKVSENVDAATENFENLKANEETSHEPTSSDIEESSQLDEVNHLEMKSEEDSESIEKSSLEVSAEDSVQVSNNQEMENASKKDDKEDVEDSSLEVSEEESNQVSNNQEMENASKQDDKELVEELSLEVPAEESVQVSNNQEMENTSKQDDKELVEESSLEVPAEESVQVSNNQENENTSKEELTTDETVSSQTDSNENKEILKEPIELFISENEEEFNDTHNENSRTSESTNVSAPNDEENISEATDLENVKETEEPNELFPSENEDVSKANNEEETISDATEETKETNELFISKNDEVSKANNEEEKISEVTDLENAEETKKANELFISENEKVSQAEESSLQNEVSEPEKLNETKESIENEETSHTSTENNITKESTEENCPDTTENKVNQENSSTSEIEEISLNSNETKVTPEISSKDPNELKEIKAENSESVQNNENEYENPTVLNNSQELNANHENNFNDSPNCETQDSRENSPQLSESSKSLSQSSVKENQNHSTTQTPITQDLETNLCNNSSIVVEDIPSEITTPSPTVTDSTISGGSSNNSILDSSTVHEVQDPSKIIVNPIDNNGLACNAITSKLSDIAEVAESLDAVIRDVQENVQTVEVESNPSPSDKKLGTLSSEDWHSRSTEDDSFATASEGNFTPHSLSSASFQTASGRTSSYISCDKNSFDASEADDSTYAFEMPELTSPLNMSFEGSEQSYLSAQLLNGETKSQDNEKTPTKLSENGSQSVHTLEEDESSIADIEELHSESVTPTPEQHYDGYHVDSIPIESETELEIAGIADAPSLEILTEHTAMPLSRTPEVSASTSNACSNQNPLTTQMSVTEARDSNDQQEQQSTNSNNNNSNNKPNAAWRRSKYYENITKQTIKGFL